MVRRNPKATIYLCSFNFIILAALACTFATPITFLNNIYLVAVLLWLVL